MTKKVFCKKLSEKLRVLGPSEIEGIVTEYSDHIDQKIAAGKSEEEAIADFGDLDELVEDILSAYCIKRDPKRLEDYVNLFIRFINDLTTRMMKFTGKQLVSFLVEFVLFLLVLWAVKIPLLIIFSFFTSFIFSPIRQILRFLFDASYCLISLYICYVYLQKRLMENKEEDYSIGKKEEVAVKAKAS